MENKKSIWPIKAKGLASELHSQLSLTNKNWHQLKGNSDRRAAELITGALVQLISEGKPSDVEELLEQAVRWVRREIKDPGCPNH